LLMMCMGCCFAAEMDHWIADQNGCKHFNYAPKPEESITWSGGCKNGYGDGLGELKWYKNGVVTQVIQAVLMEGKLNGKVKFAGVNGRSYEGDYLNGEMTGKGVMIWPNGNRYEGGFLRGEMSGKGVFVWANGDRYEGDFLNGKRDGQGEGIDKNGNKYKGGFLSGKKDGYGVYYMSNTGNTYEGMFKEGKANGKGLLTIGSKQDDAGYRYEGNFFDNELSGAGKIIYPNGHEVLCIFVHSECRF